MKHRSLIRLATVIFVALFTWSLMTTIGTAVTGGHDQFVQWRTDHVSLYYGLWIVLMIAVGGPILYFVGRELQRFTKREEETALAAKGVGRFAASALRGDKRAIGKLLSLLDDPTPVVRYQAARALALLDDADTNKELFRKVRYWDVNLKLGLIDALKRTSDMRTAKLMRMLAKDRNPMVSRKASTAMPIVNRASSMDAIVEQRKRVAQKKTAKEAAKRKAAGPPETDEAAAPAPAAAKPAAGQVRDEAEPHDEPSSAPGQFSSAG